MRWWRRWRERLADERAAAAAEARAAQQRLRLARQDWPAVNAAHDRLAEWIDAALRGGNGR